MVDELQTVATEYYQKWQALTASRADQSFFAALRPTALAWKTTDRTDFDRRCLELMEYSDQVHLGWVNERWLGTFHLRDATLPQGITIIKLMQRRPGSTDATGLDHVDFLIPAEFDAKVTLTKEADLQWSEEKNGEHCQWLSIWFGGTEAKLRKDTVIDVCAEELQDINPGKSA